MKVGLMKYLALYLIMRFSPLAQADCRVTYGLFTQALQEATQGCLSSTAIHTLETKNNRPLKESEIKNCGSLWWVSPFALTEYKRINAIIYQAYNSEYFLGGDLKNLAKKLNVEEDYLAEIVRKNNEAKVFCPKGKQPLRKRAFEKLLKKQI
ncbi:MAG: hypothetical protein A2Z20_02960 [Bdellovibrionales bacterium RBG_16_40_8]|nr:MAG: hypothetical protein A2Z20_02960 [Bdellovibrionales bacterium RBG_16_40_8]